MTSYAQTLTPDPAVPCTAGWCLQYVRQAFGIPAPVYPTATAAWEASATQHPDQDFPDAWVPVWFAVADVPAGHVALRAPDGSIYSTSDYSSTAHHHPSIGALINYYAPYHPLTYLGWTEDVEGTAVITPLKGNRMPTLDLQDLEAIQGLDNTLQTVLVAEIRAQVGALGNQLAAHLGMDPHALAQALLEAGTITITPTTPKV